MEFGKNKRLYELLRDFIDIYSPSGKEETLLFYLEEYLNKEKIVYQKQPVEEDRFNLILPGRDSNSPAFIGHIDTVVETDNAFFSRQGDLIKGLGSSDMKGGCAAMLDAFITYRELEAKPFPASLVFLVGEEESGDGAYAYSSQYKPKWALIAEPTSLNPCLSHYHYLEFQLIATGFKKHASLASPKDNAIHHMLDLLNEILVKLENMPDIIFNIRDINSMRSGLTVPDRCDAYLDIHLPPNLDFESQLVSLREFINEIANKKSSNISFMESTIHKGYEIYEQDHAFDLLKSIHEEKGIIWQPSSFQSDSDACILYEAGIKSIVLGPGSLEMAHRPDESISFAEVIKARDLYLALLKQMQ